MPKKKPCPKKGYTRKKNGKCTPKGKGSPWTSTTKKGTQRTYCSKYKRNKNGKRRKGKGSCETKTNWTSYVRGGMARGGGGGIGPMARVGDAAVDFFKKNIQNVVGGKV